MSEHVIEASVCGIAGCGCVLPTRVRDPETGRYSDEWCGHVGTGERVTFVPAADLEKAHEALRSLRRTIAAERSYWPEPLALIDAVLEPGRAGS